MTVPSTPLSSDGSFSTYIRRPSTFEELHQPTLGQEVREIADFISGLSTTEERDEVLRSLASLLPQADSHHAGVACIVSGIVVESGGTPMVSVDDIMDVLIRHLTQIKEYEDSGVVLKGEEKFRAFPDACKAASGIRFSVPAAMAMLSRDLESRKKWQSRADLVKLVNELEDHLPWFMENMLSLLDDVDIFLVDVKNKRVFVAHLTGVQNRMYHFFALAQHSLLEYAGAGYLNAEASDPLAVRYAQNIGLSREDFENCEDIGESTRFDFEYPGGLFLPGSCAFQELPRFQNEAFMVIKEQGSGGCPTSHWSPSNIHPVLHENLTSRVEIVRELSGDELERWIQAVAGDEP